MKWLNFIDEVYLVNLQHRVDRLLESAKQLEEYDIPYTVFPAIEDKENGSRGLRDSMLELFNDAIKKEHRNVLVLEDDFEILVSIKEFHEVLNNVVEQLPPYYYMCFLGCQISGSVSHFVGSNVISAQKMFSTHSVFYSKDGMREIINCGFDYPIDNYYVSTIEPMGKSFCTYPLLATQKPGFSNIGGQFMDWRPFIDGIYLKKVAQLNRKW